MPGSIVPNPTISKLYMFDAFNGWALGDGYLLRTNDGGSTWYNVTMPGVQYVGNAFFQNSTRGWVFGPSPDMQSNVGVLFRTIDGGRTWTQYNTPFNGGLIQFLNDANGYVLSGLPSGMNKQACQPVSDYRWRRDLDTSNLPMILPFPTTPPFQRT